MAKRIRIGYSVRCPTFSTKGIRRHPVLAPTPGPSKIDEHGCAIPNEDVVRPNVPVLDAFFVKDAKDFQTSFPEDLGGTPSARDVGRCGGKPRSLNLFHF